MNIPAIGAMVISSVVSSGVGAVVGNAIKASTPANATTLKKVTIGVGGLVLSSMVGQQAVRHTGEQIDQTMHQISELKGALKK